MAARGDERAARRQGRGFATLRLPSTEMRRVPIDCRATLGIVGNSEHELIQGRQGRTPNRWKGIRPRPVVWPMNPGRPPAVGRRKDLRRPSPVSPWGQPRARSRLPRRPDALIIRPSPWTRRAEVG